jgi:uncharacterized protein YjbJ (UPF0337 family)
VEELIRSKGRGSKEATGVITHNDLSRERESWIRRVGKVKEKTEEAVDKIKNVLTNNRLKRQAK